MSTVNNKNLQYDISDSSNMKEVGISICKKLQVKNPSFAVWYSNIKPYLKKRYLKFIEKNLGVLASAIVYERDYLYDAFAISTLEKSYFFKIKGESIETPQFLFMRVAIQVGWPNISDVLDAYHLLTTKKYIHASPTLMNSCLKNNQLSSCFLCQVDDTMDSITEYQRKCALLSKHNGGLGASFSRLRHGKVQADKYSRGPIPFIRMFDSVANASITTPDTVNIFDTMAYSIDQGGKRSTAMTIFLNSWHMDMEWFIELLNPIGLTTSRAYNLKYCVWVQDLFMVRAIKDEKWSLFNPSDVPGLVDLYGEDFVKLYTQYENDDRIPRKTVSARDLLLSVCKNQASFSAPYLMFDDAANIRSNQRFAGHHMNSNLCLEVILHCDPGKYMPSCNLCSINVSAFTKEVEGKKVVDWNSLYSSSMKVCKYMNNVIRESYALFDEVKQANEDFRPLGISIIGFADLLCILDIPYDSDEAVDLVTVLSACIEHALINASNSLVQEYGAFKDWQKSPIADGLFQFDLAREDMEHKKHLLQSNDMLHKYGFDSILKKRERLQRVDPSRFECSTSWTELAERNKRTGMVNSVLTTTVPSATISQIIGASENIEPYHSMIYNREGIFGAFIVMNDYMVQDLKKLGLWNEDTVNFIRLNTGSIQGISDLYPDHKQQLQRLEHKYKGGFEIPWSRQHEIFYARQQYVDMSQSFNWRLEDPTINDIFNAHIVNWIRGLKTSLYYLHCRQPIERIKYTITNKPTKTVSDKELSMVCRRNDPNCLVCQ